MKRPERQPGMAPEEDFYPSKKGVAGVLAASALLTAGTVVIAHETTPEPASETAVYVPYACEADGAVVPYDLERAEQGAALTGFETEDATILTCPEGSSLNTDQVKVEAVSGGAAAIPDSTEISFGNTHGDPVLEVSVDKKAGTVTVTTDPVARVEGVDGVQR